MHRSPSPPDNAAARGITIAAAKFSSEDAATLVQYVIAIVEYTQVAGPLATAVRKQNDLETEIAETERRQLEKLKEVSGRPFTTITSIQCNETNISERGVFGISVGVWDFCGCLGFRMCFGLGVCLGLWGVWDFGECLGFRGVLGTLGSLWDFGECLGF